MKIEEMRELYAKAETLDCRDLDLRAHVYGYAFRGEPETEQIKDHLKRCERCRLEAQVWKEKARQVRLYIESTYKS